ncbi:methyl-accepting chemotaxis protein [Geomonas sp. RF6]|uniref:methyl-accepting chemotaxis protein n=1 Tax=Geomonas sp. RF6 TaxID=2897342 RepID=UPI001E332B74|nr:methyl-accepting chemotaxis protein [Geomonas sp. RF6]UFS69160.1 methyl-accepting chemotaxis protein [Geomonas sp. RF6]
MAAGKVSRFSVFQQILVLALIAVLGLVVLSVASFGVVGKVKVSSPLYREIVQGKDLVADILPPPEYIIESYLVVLQANHASDPQKEQQLLERFKRLKSEYDERHAFWEKELAEGEMKRLMVEASYQPAQAFFNEGINSFFPALMRGDREKSEGSLKTLASLYESHRQQIDRLVTITNAKGVQVEQETAALLSRSSFFMISLCLVVLLSFGAVSALIIRSISGTFALCTSITDRIAAGDLTVAVPVEGRGSVRVMLGSLKTMVDRFDSMLHQIGTTSTLLADASQELSRSSEEIAQNAESAAAESTGMATASQQMAATSRDISRNCQSAAESSQNTSAIAENGVEIVGGTITIMERIAVRVKGLADTVGLLGERSDQIGEIIGTIEDIADQTNLLALNAAIEAARAGEQGRGFAVVADEVRALAERTTKATREIGEMIKAIQTETKGVVNAMEQGVAEVEHGTEEATKSSSALQEILEQVNAVSLQVTQIASAAEEQTATTAMISGNIQEITTLVQRTAQESHECASQAAQLSRCAQDLETIVHQFKVA